MLRREDFVFTIGYQGNTAIVDGKLKSKFRNLSTEELARQGLYKPAICSAIFNDSAEELEVVRNIINKKRKKKINTIAELKKVYGVTELPQGVDKALVI